MPVWIFAAGYGATWLVTARLLFGWWRSRGMTARRGRWCPAHGSDTDTYGTRLHRPGCCFGQAAGDDAYLALIAMLAAVVWPVALMAAAVRVKPPATAAELAAREKARGAGLERVRARNAELERDLGITAAEGEGQSR